MYDDEAVESAGTAVPHLVGGLLMDTGHKHDPALNGCAPQQRAHNT